MAKQGNVAHFESYYQKEIPKSHLEAVTKGPIKNLHQTPYPSPQTDTCILGASGVSSEN